MDIKCVVCGEPWDAWGVRHGDMRAWEADLFDKGAGCPCCKGDAEQPFDPTSIEDFDNGDDDPMKRINAWENAGKVEWEEPPPYVIKTCHGCGVKLVWSNERPYEGRHKPTGREWLEWDGGERVHYRYGTAYRYGDLPGGEEPGSDQFLDIGQHPYCPGCAEDCRRCGVVSIFKRLELELGKPYGGGTSFFYEPLQMSVCVDCFEELIGGEDEEEEE